MASDLNMDVRTLQNYKLLAEMIPEIEELMDTGIVSKWSFFDEIIGNRKQYKNMCSYI